jgi:tRNA pseudouridine(38-40) synthase
MGSCGARTRFLLHLQVGFAALRCSNSWLVSPSSGGNPCTARTLFRKYATQGLENDLRETTGVLDENSGIEPPRVLTSALLHVSYDGRHFTGWSAGNDSGNWTIPVPNDPENKRKRRRRDNQPKGYVRSVQGVLQANLAKLYGNIDPARVVVEGCSRTDGGVHAVGMVAQVYCLTEEAFLALHTSENSAFFQDLQQPSIPGKRLPHPRNSTDVSCFEPLPKNLSHLAFTLNRMFLDVTVMAIAELPTIEPTSHPFHPTLSARWKTYRYALSVGKMYDPTCWKHVWNVGATSADFAVRANLACKALCGSHNFAAFQGAPRGADDKQKRETQNTTCTLSSVSMEVASSWQDSETYVVHVTGDRFLYKMVRFLVGAIVAVGKGKLSVSDVETMLQTGVRLENEIECAPPHGLILQEVQYDVPIDWQPAST